MTKYPMTNEVRSLPAVAGPKPNFLASWVPQRVRSCRCETNPHWQMPIAEFRMPNAETHLLGFLGSLESSFVPLRNELAVRRAGPISRQGWGGCPEDYKLRNESNFAAGLGR